MRGLTPLGHIGGVDELLFNHQQLLIGLHNDRCLLYVCTCMWYVDGEENKCNKRRYIQFYGAASDVYSGQDSVNFNVNNYVHIYIYNIIYTYVICLIF